MTEMPMRASTHNPARYPKPSQNPGGLLPKAPAGEVMREIDVRRLIGVSYEQARKLKAAGAWPPAMGQRSNVKMYLRATVTAFLEQAAEAARQNSARAAERFAGEQR